MADVKARELPTSQAFDPTTDYLLAIKGDASGARSGPYKVPAQNVSVGSATSGGGGSGGGGGTVVGGIAKVFGREGPEISAAANDYTAAQVDFDPTTSGLAADNVQTAIDAVAALRETLPVPGSEGDVLTADGAGNWSSQPPTLVSVFGREGAVDAMSGDYHADQIAQVKTVGEDPNVATTNRFVTAAQIAKLTSLNEALQMPDPSSATLGHVATIVDSSGTKVWAAAAPTGGGGGGGGLSQIDLFPFFRGDSANPPSWVYSSGAATWQFSSSGTQPLFAEIDYWPGGTATINFTYSCSVTSGNIQWFFIINPVTPASAELLTKAWSNQQALGSVAVADNVNKILRVTGTISGIDGVAAGDHVRISCWRNNGASGNAAGTAILRGCTLRFTFS